MNPPIAGAEVRKALMVCVTFPNIVDPGIPTWLPPMAGEGVEGKLEEYHTTVPSWQLERPSPSIPKLAPLEALRPPSPTSTFPRTSS